MIELTGVSLGKRQQELNTKVNEAVQKQINFDEIKALEEKSDVDRLYKIDVASGNKNIDYIIEVLKCGDSLYVSRALKSDWLYRDEYAHIINPDYLHYEIFPHMSLKMKTKMVNTIASNVRNETRAVTFFEYCQSLKMNKIAFKFILFTSESFKLNVIENDVELINSNSENIKHFIGNSFKLASAYIWKLNSYSKNDYLMQLSYLYTVDNEQYLDLFEENIQPLSSKSFGGRMSKSIMTKHKSRVLRAPLLYIQKLNKYMIARHSTSDDAKKYIIALFPKKLEEFWNCDLYHSYKYLFDIIPNFEVFEFFKNTFISLYGNEPFEMNINFYHYKYYEILTTEETEQWALKLIEEGEELLGSNNDYIWYTFVKFDRAFKAIKQYILITTDEDERNKMVRVLIHSSRNQRDLENLFNYFYERFVNESGHHKDRFIDEVIDNNNVFEFDDPCWAAFNKILYSMQVYTPGFYGKDHYRTICVLYNIIHNKDMPDALTYYMDCDIDFWQIKKLGKNSNNLKKEEWDSVYEYLYDYYSMKFKTVDKNDTYETEQEKIKFAKYFINLLECFEKTKDDLPTLVLSYIEQNIEEFKHFTFFRVDKEDLTEATLLCLLKKDKNIVINKLPDVLKHMNHFSFRLTRLVKKIRIYFSNDVASDFVHFFNKYIVETSKNKFDWNFSKTSVYGIFMLADESFKMQFLTKYIPKEAKIDHSKIDRKLLEIQEAICRFACYARPPVPLDSILQYVKGDYIHFCLPMINMYFANLPLPLSKKLIEFLLDAPVSIQKHGIRLAFTVYNSENLKTLISNIWQKTKNVSLRVVIYKALVNKIKVSNESAQNELIDSLITLTSSLHEQDQDDIFNILVSNDIPTRFRADLYEAAWGALKKLSHKKARNLQLKTKMIKSFEDCSNLMNRDYCRTQIIDEHVHNMLHKKGIQKTFKSEEENLHTALWRLTALYIISCNSQSELEKSLTLLESIVQEAFKHWGLIVDNKYAVIEFFHDFIKNMKTFLFRILLDSYKGEFNNSYIIAVFEKILRCIQEFSPSHEMFLMILDVKLFILLRKVNSEKVSDIKQVAQLVYKSLLMFIQDLKANKQLFPSFFRKISNLIKVHVVDLALIMNLNADILIAYICNELVTVNDIEAILFAISIIPVESQSTEEELFKKLSLAFKDKLKEINNFEVQSYYYNKFVLSDFRKRYEH